MHVSRLLPSLLSFKKAKGNPSFPWQGFKAVNGVTLRQYTSWRAVALAMGLKPPASVAGWSRRTHQNSAAAPADDSRPAHISSAGNNHDKQGLSQAQPAAAVHQTTAALPGAQPIQL